jgi:peptidoglycan-associated lipoprotein
MNARFPKLIGPSLVLSALALSQVLVIGCGGTNDKPALTASSATSTVRPESTGLSAAAPPTQVREGEDVRKACNVQDVEKPAKFDFDSTDLTDLDRDALKQIATCLTSGALKGRNVRLVGRADPRGEPEYNMSLGAARAKAAQAYLTALGVEAGRLRETSRCELDASGTDESGWANDRRVDVLLAQ